MGVICGDQGAAAGAAAFLLLTGGRFHGSSVYVCVHAHVLLQKGDHGFNRVAGALACGVM